LHRTILTESLADYRCVCQSLLSLVRVSRETWGSTKPMGGKLGSDVTSGTSRRGGFWTLAVSRSLACDGMLFWVGAAGQRVNSTATGMGKSWSKRV